MPGLRLRTACFLILGSSEFLPKTRTPCTSQIHRAQATQILKGGQQAAPAASARLQIRDAEGFKASKPTHLAAEFISLRRKCTLSALQGLSGDSYPKKCNVHSFSY